ncbi:MAG: HAD family phosphatase [Leptospira sp.]|nr:HAD family phosphatase [Leptospira sp.]
MSSLEQIEGIIFDMDGVIVDNHRFHFRAWMEFASKYKFELNDEIYRNDFNGKTNADLFRMIFGKITEEEILAYSLEKEVNYQKLYASEIKPHTGLVEFLKDLKSKNYRIALGTSAPTTNVDFTMNALGMRDYFDVIIDGSQVSKGKPDPEVYLKCAKSLGLHPNHCVVFEDSLAGLQSGKNAGCSIIGVATSHTREELLPTVKNIINDFTEIGNQFPAVMKA